MEGTVRLRSRDGAEWTAVAGPTGEFRFKGLPRNTSFDIEATAPGCVAHRIPWVWIGQSGRVEFPQVPLGAGIPLEIRAVDAEGAPVRGAEIAVRRAVGAQYLLEGSVDRPPEVRATTGEDGGASFPSMAAGWWIVDAAAKGFGDERCGVTLREGERREPLRVLLVPSCTLHGKVLDEAGKPLAGVAVQAIRGSGWWDEGAPRGSAVSGEDGAYRIERLVGGSHLLALRPGPGIVECAGGVDLDGDTLHDVRLSPRSALSGRVEDAVTLGPVAGAPVEVMLGSAPGIPYRTQLRASTDAAGGFSFDAAPAAAVDLFSVQAAGYVPYPDASTPPASVPRALLPGVSHGLTVSLRRGGSVRGIVRDPQGRPVAGAWVENLALRMGGDVDQGLRAVSDAEGRYRIEAANPGRNALRAGAFNLHLPGVPRNLRDALRKEGPPPPYTVEVPESGEVVRDLALVPDCRVEGRMVHRDGTPAAGIRPRLVTGRDPESTMGTGQPSRADGAFVIEDIEPAPGDYRVAAGGPPGRLGTSEPFALAESGTIQGLVVTVAPPASLEGRVRRGDGRAPGAATVRLVRAASGDILEGRAFYPLNEAARSTAAADGTFRFEGLDPGPWTPIAAADGCVETMGATVEIGEGESKTGADVVLPAARGIAGRVVNGAGAPVPGALVVAGPLEARPLPEGTVSAVASYADQPLSRSDAEGKFVLRGLGSGTCRVAARAEDFPAWVADVEAGTTDLVVVLTAGLRIEGVVREKTGGKPVEGVKVNCFGLSGSDAEAWTAADGTFTLRGLAEGPYSVDIFERSGQPWAPLTVRGVAAGTKGLVLALQKGLSVSGRCVDASGRTLDAKNLRITILGAEGGRGIDLAADGGFLFERIVPGPCRIMVASSGTSGVGGYLPRSVDCQAGDRDVVVALARGKSITGRVVTEDGSPPGPDISLESCPAGSRGVSACFMYRRVQEDGTFCTDPYEEGAAQDLLVHAPGGFCATVRDVAPGSEGVVLRLERTVSISGRVAFPEGVPTEGTGVVAMPAAGVRLFYAVDAGKDGSFAFEALPRGSYRLYARSQYSNLAAVEWETPLTGGETGVVVRTVVGHVLRVRIRHADGSPLADSEFPVIDHEFGGLPESLGMYREGDAFVVRGLQAGPVTVRLISRPALGKPGVGVIAVLDVPCPEQTLTAPR
jgi:hypothetical protein